MWPQKAGIQARWIRSGFTSRADQTAFNALLFLFGPGLWLARQYRHHAADVLSPGEIQERVAHRTSRALVCTRVTNYCTPRTCAAFFRSRAATQQSAA